MVFVLSSQNVGEYLQNRKIVSSPTEYPSTIKAKDCKNFNLLVSFNQNSHYLVKQERYDLQGKTKGEFQQEWSLQKLVRNFPELYCLQNLISEAIDYDRDNSIIIFNYLDNYCDLADFYHREQTFTVAIAASLGNTLGNIHRLTFYQNQYRDFLAQESTYNLFKKPNLYHYLNRLEPELFGKVGEDAFKFYRLYQQDTSISQAIYQLNQSWQNCCLIHGDFRLVNILLLLSWQENIELLNQEKKTPAIIKIIDWERFSWGDPAFDLGTIIANYLKLWLGSLMVGTDIDLQTALSLAVTPLEFIQPSLLALVISYLATFPKIIKFNPHFINRVIQFAGFHLIEHILTQIEYREPFDNTGICMLQVAKSLLCNPQQSMTTIFGNNLTST